MEKSDAAKRRHARPLELDSDDEEKEEDNTHNDNQQMSDQVEAIIPVLMVNACKVIRVGNKIIAYS